MFKAGFIKALQEGKSQKIVCYGCSTPGKLKSS